MSDNSMTKLIQYYAFTYGCLGAVFSLAWYVAAFWGQVKLPNSVWIVEGAFALHAIAAIATFQRSIGQSAWLPMIRVTPKRLKLGKILLGISLLNFICCLGVFIVAVVWKNEPLIDTMVTFILTSFLLMNTIYIAIHWAFRPENLFSESFIRAVSNPLGVFSSHPNDR